MSEREEKHLVLPSHHASDFKEQGIIAALEGVKKLGASKLPLEELSKQITAITRSALKANCVALWLSDDMHKHLSLLAYACIDSTETNPKKYNISLDEPLPVTECVKDGKASIHKKQTLSEFDPRAAALTKTYVSGVIPLVTPEGVIGVFELLTAANDPIHSSELDALDLLASQITLMVANRLNVTNLSRQSNFQKQLYEIAVKINQAKDYESIMQITIEELCSTLDLPAASMHINLAATATKSNSNTEDIS